MQEEAVGWNEGNMSKKTKPIRRKWSDDELKLLKENFPIKKMKEVAAQLGRPMPSVINRAYIMGIKKKSFY